MSHHCTYRLGAVWPLRQVEYAYPQSQQSLEGAPDGGLEKPHGKV